MESIEIRVIRLEQQVADMEKMQQERYDSFRQSIDDLKENVSKQIAGLRDFVSGQIENYIKDNRKFMYGILSAVIIAILVSVVKTWL